MASIAPFPRAPISGYDFGTRVPPGGWTGTGSDFGWPVHLGTDFGTPAGEPIVASADAKVTFQSGLYGYGNKLTEQFANGWELVFGHVAGGLSGFARAGQQIGVTGRDVGDSVGAVTLVQLLNPAGQAVNPDATLQSTWANIAQTFEKQAQQAAGTSSPFTPFAKFTPATAPSADPFGITAGLTAFGGQIAAIPTSIGHGLADALAVTEQDIAEWFKRQSVAFFVAAVVLLVLFL